MSFVDQQRELLRVFDVCGSRVQSVISPHRSTIHVKPSSQRASGRASGWAGGPAGRWDGWRASGLAGGRAYGLLGGRAAGLAGGQAGGHWRAGGSWRARKRTVIIFYPTTPETRVCACSQLALSANRSRESAQRLSVMRSVRCRRRQPVQLSF